MRISKVIPQIDRPALAQSFEFWELRTSKKYIPHGAAVLDSEELAGKVEAVAFCGGCSALVMARVGELDRFTLVHAIQSSGDDSLRVKRLPVSEIPDRELLQLLLASLAKSRFDRVACSNLGGRLLVVSPSHIRRRGKRLFQVHALEVAVTPDMYLALRVRTFTSLAWRKQIRPRKVPIEKLPRYKLAHGLLRRAPRAGLDNPEAFIERTVGDDRYGRFAFLDVSSPECFAASKIGILNEVLERLMARYGDVASLEFDEIEDSYNLARKSVKPEDWRKRVALSLGSCEIYVVDATGEEADLAKRLAGRVQDLFGISVAFSERVEENCLCLRIIHEDAYYGDGTDPHDSVPDGAIVQHVTVEMMNSKKANRKKDPLDSPVESSLKELAIKRDVARGMMTLVEWPSLGLGAPWSFGVACGEGTDAFLDIDSDGNLLFAREEPNLRKTTLHAEMSEALHDVDDADFVMRGPDGDINVVGRTDLYTVPDAALIASVMSSEGKMSRSKTSREQYLSEVVDIAFARTGEKEGYYRVGVIGDGMQSKLVRASVLRKVRAAEGSSLLFPQALPLLDMVFVRLRALTVVPFPIKYLREWAGMHESS